MHSEFTKDELTKIYDMARDSIDMVMAGNWDAVQEGLELFGKYYMNLWD